MQHELTNLITVPNGEPDTPIRTTNPFFGVGPISDATVDEVSARQLRFTFEHWVEKTFRKIGGNGRDLGPYTVAELGRSMHRGEPADSVLQHMLEVIHSYFGFPKSTKLAVGLGGGHSGFTACALNMINSGNAQQHIFVDTPMPESDPSLSAGFFRQSWATQLIELLRHSRQGDEERLCFAEQDGHLPDLAYLAANNIQVVFGVGHETTGATTYTDEEVSILLKWIDLDPTNHHVIIDATSLLGAMPWREDTIADVMAKFCMFMPFQKAIGGVAGYFLVALTDHALALIDKNCGRPGFAIPRQLKLAAPENARKPLSSKPTTALGPIYDPITKRMRGGIVNTYSLLAFAETAFAVTRLREIVGPVEELNRRSCVNRDAVEAWLKENSLFEHGVDDMARRGPAVTLLRVNDPSVQDAATRAKIVERAKRILSFEGLTASDGSYVTGLDVARFVNAFPGTPGDFRAWIGGIRDVSDVLALLENIRFAYVVARRDILGLEMPRCGERNQAVSDSLTRDISHRAFKVLICDPGGLKFNADKRPDTTEVEEHIRQRGGCFYHGELPPDQQLEAGKVHFSYQPNLHDSELVAKTAKGEFDAVIAAATEIPAECRFDLGGVRIGAGTGNMKSNSWQGSENFPPQAPLMNTPSFNSRATAQMLFKALLSVLPDLQLHQLNQEVRQGRFDTRRHLHEHPSKKLEGMTIAVLGFGNIGREVARIATVFGMRVTVFSRPRHRNWIESEGYLFADSMAAAASGADVLTVHLGLGRFDPEMRRHENAAAINQTVIERLRDNAVVINFDRGEVVDVIGLGHGLRQGKVKNVIVDADIFIDDHGVVCGPLEPYRSLAELYPDRVLLLPHVAADTDHPSRVAGAKQAIDQILESIVCRRVTNLKGTLPNGYEDAGGKTVPGVGPVTKSQILDFCSDADEVSGMRRLCEELSAIWGGLDSASDEAACGRLIERYGARLVEVNNLLRTKIRQSGLYGIFE